VAEIVVELHFDWSRPPTKVEHEQLERRRCRMDTAALPDHLAALNAKLLAYERPASRLRTAGLRIRPAFSCLPEPIPGDSSDRKAPPREDRPSATRIMTSRGCALQLQLTTMALLQLYRKPGAKAHLVDLDLSITGDSQHTGWADLIPAVPTDNNAGGTYHTSRDKRARSVRSALITLDKAGLVDIPGTPGQRDRFEGFVPLNEVGTDVLGERLEYTVPGTKEGTFPMPPGFVLNGWMHLLEDSEITALLMIACGREAWMENGHLVFPGAVRVRHYGIHRDRFATARKTLEWFGLSSVEEVGRHRDGRAEDDERFVHRLRLLPDGFNEPALPAIQEAIRRQLTRA